MKNCLQLKLVTAAVLMVNSVAHAGIVNINVNGSVDNPYLMSVVGTTANVLSTTVTGRPSSFFEEFSNFTIPTLSTTSVSANTYSLNLEDTDVSEITGLTVGVWSDTHPRGSTLFGSLLGNNATHLIGHLATGQYQFGISSRLGSSAHIDPVVLQALPVPKPETHAMLLAGLGLVSLSISRRR